MIHNRLSTILGERRMSIKDFTRGSGINYSSAHQMYHGRTNRYDTVVLDKACGFLNIQVGDLLVYVPDEDKGE